MKNISSVRRASRSAKNGQHPYIDELPFSDVQRLMDLSGFPCRSGNIYTLISDRGKRALRFDGNAYYGTEGEAAQYFED